MTEYPFTPEQLSDLIDRLDKLFIRGRVMAIPEDCELFEEDINCEYEYVPAESMHLSIRKPGNPKFRIFDLNNDLRRLRGNNLPPTLHIMGAMIRKYAERQIEKHRGVAVEPWEYILDESIRWQSAHGCLELDIFTELCGTPEQDVANQPDLCLVNYNTRKITFQGDDYHLTPRQFEILTFLEYQVDPIDGMTRGQIISNFNESEPESKLTSSFKMSKTFAGETAKLLGTLIQTTGGRKPRYSLRQPLARRSEN